MPIMSFIGALSAKTKKLRRWTDGQLTLHPEAFANENCEISLDITELSVYKRLEELIAEKIDGASNKRVLNANVDEFVLLIASKEISKRPSSAILFFYSSKIELITFLKDASKIKNNELKRKFIIEYLSGLSRNMINHI